LICTHWVLWWRARALLGEKDNTSDALLTSIEPPDDALCTSALSPLLWHNLPE
jgi:PIN domain nuclease of toxin-antitoxin system